MKIGAFTDAAGVEGLGFAIPSTTVKQIVDQLIAQGYVSGRPALNLEGGNVSSFDQRFNRLPAGVLISQVYEGGCAQKAGLAAGDIIIAFGGYKIGSTDDLSAALYQFSAGDTVEVTVYRYRTGKQYTLTILLQTHVFSFLNVLRFD